MQKTELVPLKILGALSQNRPSCGPGYAHQRQVKLIKAGEDQTWLFLWAPSNALEVEDE